MEISTKEHEVVFFASFVDALRESGDDVKLSIRENMAPGSNLMERCRNLQKLGYDGIELTNTCQPEQVDEIKAAVQETGIQPSIVGAGGGCLLDARKAERDLAVQRHKTGLEVAAAVGAVGILSVPLLAVTMQGRPRIPDLSPYMKTEALERAVLIELYREISAHAQKLGVYLIVEPLNRYEQFWPRTLADGVSICREVGNPHCRMMADFFHMHIEEADIAASIREAGEFIYNVHLADSNRQTPGRGHLDFLPGFRALKDIGYDKFCGIECGVPGDRMEELARTAKHLRELWEKA